MHLARFLTELKRRRVYRAATVYAAVGFLVIQAADVILPNVGVPDWGVSLVVVLTILGFPVALVLAWALELTPQGLRVTASATPDEGTPLPSALGHRTVLVAGLLVVLGVGVGAGWFLKPGVDAAPGVGATGVDLSERPTPDSRSVAVLPFSDLSPAGDQEWFADGLTEEILNSLARLGELRVTARNSSFQFKGRAVDVREVGTMLGVANVLEGSVRRVDDRLRITAQLIRASDGFHLWSETYDRNLDDVFAVQEDIAGNIARVLDVYLDDTRRERMVASGTRDPAAYLHYLRGRDAYARSHQLGVGESDLLWQANGWFERALEADPGYALARFYHHDAFSHALMRDLPPPPEYRRPDGSPDDARLQRQMQADLDRAVADAGDPELGRAFAIVSHYVRGEWHRLPSAIAELKIDRQPLEIVGGGWLWFPMMVPRVDEHMTALANWRLERDPLELNAWSDVISLALVAGRLEEAEQLADRAGALGLEHRYLDEARVRLMLGQGRATEVLTQMVPRLEESGIGWWAEAMAYAELGNRDQARVAIARGATTGRLHERACWILARIGDQAQANACAAEIDREPQGWIRLARVIVDHQSIPFDPQATPRFTSIYSAMKAKPWPRTQPAPAKPI